MFSEEKLIIIQEVMKNRGIKLRKPFYQWITITYNNINNEFKKMDDDLLFMLVITSIRLLNNNHDIDVMGEYCRLTFS